MQFLGPVLLIVSVFLAVMAYREGDRSGSIGYVLVGLSLLTTGLLSLVLMLLGMVLLFHRLFIRKSARSSEDPDDPRE